MSITGERLKEQRKRMEISADDVALELGVSRSTIFRYENGAIEKVPSNILEKLADILNTTPAYLMGWTDDPYNWGKLGNEEGIYPPKDYDGSYDEYVKFKLSEEQSSVDNYNSTPISEMEKIPKKEEFPPEIRAAARGMMELSPEDQKSAINMIKWLTQKGREAKED